MIETLNLWSIGWSAWMLTAIVEGTVLFALAGLVWLFVARRTSAQFGYLLFLLVLARLALPLTISVPEHWAWLSPQYVVAQAGSWLHADRQASIKTASARRREHERTARSQVHYAGVCGPRRFVAGRRADVDNRCESGTGGIALASRRLDDCSGPSLRRRCWPAWHGCMRSGGVGSPMRRKSRSRRCLSTQPICCGG